MLVCLIFHEVCHGVAAFFLGDPTAKRAHRLSLNPLHHIDWLGLRVLRRELKSSACQRSDK